MEQTINFSFSEADYAMMTAALKEAQKAMLHDDVPVGAVIVHNQTGEIIAASHNTREKEGSALGHAEISAIDQACRALKTWRLSECTLYVTLEPCPMCAGAILASRIPRVVYGAKDAVAGAMGSVWALHAHPTKQNHTKIESGCLAEESTRMLQQFFRQKREDISK